MYAVRMTHYQSLGKHLRTHLCQYNWQARTECGIMVPLTLVPTKWDGNEENLCAMCARKVKK